MLLDALRVVTQWLACDLRRAEIARLMRGYPPGPPLLGVIGWITLIGTSIAALALFVPKAERIISPPGYVFVCRLSPWRPPVRIPIGLSVSSTPSGARARFTWGAATRSCVTPCTRIVPYGARVHIAVTRPGFRGYVTDLVADGPHGLLATLLSDEALPPARR